MGDAAAEEKAALDDAKLRCWKESVAKELKVQIVAAPFRASYAPNDARSWAAPEAPHRHDPSAPPPVAPDPASSYGTHYAAFAAARPAIAPAADPAPPAEEKRTYTVSRGTPRPEKQARSPDDPVASGSESDDSDGDKAEWRDGDDVDDGLSDDSSLEAYDLEDLGEDLAPVAAPVYLRDLLAPVPNSTTGLGGPDQTSEFSSSVKSKSIRLIFGRIDCSHRVLEARRKCSCQNIRIRAH